MQNNLSELGDSIGQLHQILSHLNIFSKFSKGLYTRLSYLHYLKANYKEQTQCIVVAVQP